MKQGEMDLHTVNLPRSGVEPGSCREDKASAHDTPALPTELTDLSSFLYDYDWVTLGHLSPKQVISVLTTHQNIYDKL